MLAAFTGVALLVLSAEYCLLPHDAVWFCRYIQAFLGRWENLLAQFCTSKIETAGYTEILEHIRQTTRRHVPKDSDLYRYRLETLKSSRISACRVRSSLL